MKSEPVSAQAIAVIRDVLQQDMLRFGLEEIDVRVAPDHTGEPSLWIEVRYGLDGEPIDPRATAGLVTKLHDRLWELGEERFPYIRHIVPDDKKVVELT
jgi:hypothetical protein